MEHLADHRDRREAGEPGEVDRGLGVAAPLEHAARAGAQREHVARAAGSRSGAASGSRTRRIVMRAVGGADAAARVDVVDRHGERGVAAGARRAAPSAAISSSSSTLGVARHAHEPARPAQHEVDRLGRHPARRHREVALVLAVLVVDDEDHLAAADALAVLRRCVASVMR